MHRDPEGEDARCDRPVESRTCSIRQDSEFASEITSLIARVRPKRIVETGTYLGRGSTTIIHKALEQYCKEGFLFFTIEVDPNCYKKATNYFNDFGMHVISLNGLSIKRGTLPTKSEIEDRFVRSRQFELIDYDYSEKDRSERYFSETNYDVPDDMLNIALRQFRYQPDLLMLDSSGHVGYLEFLRVLELVKSDCFLLLDDVYHCKHYRSLLHMKTDSRFTILVESKERHGFCISHYRYL